MDHSKSCLSDMVDEEMASLRAKHTHQLCVSPILLGGW